MRTSLELAIVHKLNAVFPTRREPGVLGKPSRSIAYNFGHARPDRSRAALRRAQLRSPSRGALPRRGRLALGRRGPALPRHAVGLFGGELRLWPPAPAGGALRPGATPRGDIARFPERS